MKVKNIRPVLMCLVLFAATLVANLVPFISNAEVNDIIYKIQDVSPIDKLYENADQSFSIKISNSPSVNYVANLNIAVTAVSDQTGKVYDFGSNIKSMKKKSDSTSFIWKLSSNLPAGSYNFCFAIRSIINGNLIDHIIINYTVFKSNNILGDKIVKQAESWIGTQYVLGGNSKKGIDCSHFVKNVYTSVGLPYTYMTATNWSKNPFNPPKELKKVANPQKGDIIIFAGGNDTSLGHAGIYIDQTYFIGAQSSGVGYAKFGSYWGKSRKIVGYYRYN